MRRLVNHMVKTRKILHLDLDAFLCSVAQQLDPTIKGKAVLVGAKPVRARLVSPAAVASASYPAAFKYRATPHPPPKTPQYTYSVDTVSQNSGENRGISGGIEGDFSVSDKR